MARTVRDSKLESPTARAKLKLSGVPYWRAIDPGLHIGYRKSRDGGRWVARWYLRTFKPVLHQGGGDPYKHAKGKAYVHTTLGGIADDRSPADGAAVLSFAQAQKKVRELFGAATAPLASAGAPLTVKQACESYVEYLRAEKRTADDAKQRLAKHIYPDLAALRRDIAERRAEIARKRDLHTRAARNGSERAKERLARLVEREAALAREEAALPNVSLGETLVSALTTDDIEGVKRAMVKRDPNDPDVERRSKDTANRVMTSLKAALNRAFADPRNGIATDAAWRRVGPFEKVGRSREVFLDTAQSKRLINACTGAFRNLVTAALLTGARPPHELATLRVRDVRADLNALSIRDGKTGPRVVTLTDEAARFFKGIAAGRAPDALLLPRDDGEAWGKNHHIRPMREAVAKAKLPKDCTIYALRHSNASQVLLNGMNLKLLAENMGTSVAMIEKHYGKFLAASRRQLIEQAGFKLGLKRGNVASLT